MATVVNAKDVVVKLNDIVVGCAKSAKFDITREMDEATCSASGSYKEFSPGLISWTGSFDSVFRDYVSAETATNITIDNLMDMLVEGALVTVEYGRKAAGSTATRYSGSAYISGISYNQPDKGPLTWSANYQGSGELAKI